MDLRILYLVFRISKRTHLAYKVPAVWKKNQTYVVDDLVNLPLRRQWASHYAVWADDNLQKAGVKNKQEKIGHQRKNPQMRGILENSKQHY